MVRVIEQNPEPSLEILSPSCTVFDRPRPINRANRLLGVFQSIRSFVADSLQRGNVYLIRSIVSVLDFGEGELWVNNRGFLAKITLRVQSRNDSLLLILRNVYKSPSIPVNEQRRPLLILANLGNFFTYSEFTKEWSRWKK